MNIYDYAMKLEKDGEEFYRGVAEKTDHKGIKAIMKLLADAEVRHYTLFQNMKTHEKTGQMDTALLDTVKNIFVQIREERQFNVDVTQIELYKEAQEIETKTRDFYLDKAREVDPPQKEIFLRIAEEEKRHYLILERIIAFVNRPVYWLENPEWYHLEPY